MSPLSQTEGQAAAYPWMEPQKADVERYIKGLTKRDIFAMAAMQGLLARSTYDLDVAADAVEAADKLLAALYPDRTSDDPSDTRKVTP